VAVSAPLLVVDADSLMHRAYHALPDVKGADGRPVAALLGFTNALLQLYHGEGPRALAIGVDSRRRGYREAALPRYQAQRDPFEADLVAQLDDLPAYLGECGIAWAQKDGFEADDVLAAYCRVETEAGGRALVVTSDRDAFQLVSDAVTVLRPGGASKPYERVDPVGVVERYGVLPEQVPDLIALRGDPSDNIPGAKGIGQKTAAQLLRAHGDLEGVIASARDNSPARAAALAERAADLRMYREVATMQAEVEVERPADWTPDWERMARAAEARGIGRLASRLRERLAPAS
jgi:5'-3' exonuclease